MQDSEILISQNQVFQSNILQNLSILTIDYNGTILDVNQKFLDVFHYQKNDLTGKNIFAFIDSDISDKIDLNEISSKKKKCYLLIKFKSKKDQYFWTRNVFIPLSDQIVILQIELEENINILEQEKFRSILYQIQKLSLEIGDLKTFFDKTLEYLVTIPWFSLQSKAGFMINQDGELRLISYLNVSQSLVEMCSRVPFGRCLCGKAAQNREIIYKSHIDQDHENRPEGMQPHGHFNLPIVKGEQVLGVLFLYLEENYPQKEEHLAFLKMLSDVLSFIILKYQFENEYQYALTKFIRVNEELLKNIKKVQEFQEILQTYVPEFLRKILFNQNHKNQIHFHNEKKYYLLLNINGLLKFSNIFPIQKVYETLTEYYSPIIDIILEHQGETEQYLEDKIFAIFDNVEDAIKSSIEIHRKIIEINLKRSELLLKPFSFQIAIHYGNSFMGIIGSSKRKNWMRYSEAIRWLVVMQKKCFYNQIIVSEEIFSELKNQYKFSKRYKLIRDKDPENFIYVRFLVL